MNTPKIIDVTYVPTVQSTEVILNYSVLLSSKDWHNVQFVSVVS